MRTLSKSLLGIFLLTFTAISWAACPEGTKNNYKGECVPIAGESVKGNEKATGNVLDVNSSMQTTQSPSCSDFSKDPICAIAGRVSMQVLEKYVVNDPMAIHYDPIARRKELAVAESAAAWMCSLRPKYLTGFIAKPIIKIGGNDFRNGVWNPGGGDPIDEFIEPAVKKVRESLAQGIESWLRSGDTRYLDELREQLEIWSQADALSEMIPDVHKYWGLNWGYADVHTPIREVLVASLTAYHLLKSEKALNQTEDALIYGWLGRRMADSVMGPTDGVGPGLENLMPPGNHEETRKALVYGLWGVISNDSVYFQAAIKQFYITLDHARADGSHGWEVRKGTTGSKRSTRGLKKMNQVLNFVTIIAEIAANQGYDLYSIQNKRGVNFHKMVEFLVEASTNKNLKTSYNDSSIQDTRFLRGRKGSINLAWAEAYVRRFPDRPVSEKLAGLLANVFGIKAQPVVGGGATCIYRDIKSA